jgi:hypothetical protein
MVSQLVKKFPTINGRLRFIAVFTTALPFSYVSQINPVHELPLHF